METQAFFENIQAQIQTRLLAAETEIDLAVAWFTDRVLFDVLCQKPTKRRGRNPSIRCQPTKNTS